MSATDDGFVALAVESGLYGAAKERVEAWYSADGQTWERTTVKKPAKPGYQAVASGLADGPAGSLALGTFIGQDLAGQRLWRRGGDGTWRPATLPKVSNPVWDALVSYPRGYLLLGQSGRGMASNWRSVDGLTWKRVKDTPRLFDVAVGERGTLVGIGYKHIYRSPKGLRAWEKALTRPTSWRVGGSNAFSFVEWDGSEFVVPGNDFSGCVPNTDECHTNPLLVSVDGTAWSQAAGPDGLPGADEATWIDGRRLAGWHHRDPRPARGPDGRLGRRRSDYGRLSDLPRAGCPDPSSASTRGRPSLPRAVMVLGPRLIRRFRPARAGSGGSFEIGRRQQSTRSHPRCDHLDQR